MTDSGIGREAYVRLIAAGYEAYRLPVPEEFRAEWEAIKAADAVATDQEFQDAIADLPTTPMEVWCVMDTCEFEVPSAGPAKNGEMKMEKVNVPKTGTILRFELRKVQFFGLRPSTVLCELPVSMGTKALVGGDTLTLTVTATDLIQVLKALTP